MLLIASLLIVGCNAETPTPENNSKPDTEINREPETAVPPAVVPTPEDKPQIPEVEETVKPSPEETQKPGTEEKEETVTIIPDWLSNRSYRMIDNGNIIHFNDKGIPNISTDADLTIIATEMNKVTYKVLDNGGNETILYISRTDDGHSITLLNEKGETAVLFIDDDGPTWLKDRTFGNFDEKPTYLEFNSRGLLVTAIQEHSFTYINSMDESQVEFVYINTEGSKESLKIEKLDNGDIKATMGTESGIFESM